MSARLSEPDAFVTLKHEANVSYMANLIGYTNPASELRSITRPCDEAAWEGMQ